MKYLQTKTGPRQPHLVEKGVTDNRSWATIETIDETSCGIDRYELFLNRYYELNSKCKKCPKPVKFSRHSEHCSCVRILDDPNNEAYDTSGADEWAADAWHDAHEYPEW